MWLQNSGNLNYCIKNKEIIPTNTEAEMPNTRTGPATVNIFPPTPITQPSDLYSIAGETIELANPVIGTREPAPANFPILLKILRAVSKAAMPIKVMDTIVEQVVSSSPLNSQKSKII